VEAKSGDWGFTDIFKIKGWMAYLNIPRASLIASQRRDRFEAYERLAQKMDVQLVAIEDFQQYEKAFVPFLADRHIDRRDVATWRFYYWAERQLLHRIQVRSRSQPGVRGLRLSWTMSSRSAVVSSSPRPWRIGLRSCMQPMERTETWWADVDRKCRVAASMLARLAFPGIFSMRLSTSTN
jgi:hypothetical protein